MRMPESVSNFGFRAPPNSNVGGQIDDKLPQEMIVTAAQRIKIVRPPSPERVFDFSFGQKVAESLK